MKRFAAFTLLAALVGTSLAGCIVVPDHGDHPHHEHDDRGYYHDR